MKSQLRLSVQCVCLGLVSLIMAGCGGGSGSSGAPHFRSGEAPIGNWGDSGGINVSITSTGGALSTDCTFGSITATPTLDASESFDTVGTYTIVHGLYRNSAAHFAGKVQGNIMTLNITVNDGVNPTASLGPYVLTYGKINHNQSTCP